jgi:tetratricopeptide (TPR) repeat protein
MNRNRRTGWSIPAKIAVVTLGAAACATGGMRVPAAEIPSLETQVRTDPANRDARLRLGIAYRGQGRATEAASTLDPLVARDSTDAAALFHLALAYEDLQRWADARMLHEKNRAGGGSARLARQVEARLASLRRWELQEAADAAVQNEGNLPAPEARTVGVFPFLTTGLNEDLRPYAHAITALLTTDLAQTGRLRVLERAHMQILLDEIRMNETQRMDPATAARAGRLLSAGRIVQGRMDQTTGGIGLTALVVSVDAGPGGTPGRALGQDGALNQLFELEKQLALSLYAELGVQLTVAERERITTRQTENLQALLAFGYGLEAMDAGQYAEAVQHFERAAQLDPQFEEAREELETARGLETGRVTNTTLAARIAMEELGAGAQPPTVVVQDRFAEIEAIIPSPQHRDAVTEMLGVEGLTRGGLIVIIVRRPAGT